MTDPQDVIRPLMRPFIVRPVAYAAMPAAFLAAASYFFWAPLTDFIGEFALALPILCALVPLLVLVERVVRYRKTEYVVRPDRILVRTGTIFLDRAIELELENITLVEWHSPFLLRKFYGAGHVTAQEAGSATQNARLAYIDHPERLYERIAELMRDRGFSMRRNTRIRQEQPGPVGAMVDLFGRTVALIYGLAIFGVTEGANLWLVVADDAGPSVLQLVLGNYAAFSETEFALDVLVKMRLGVVVLGALFLAGTGLFLALSYIDLLRRKYTLHDDVIDYEDGFLSQTRRFIPLENLADTKLTRPLHKRLLGFGDLRVSSRGAGNEIVFQSMPRGPEFARDLERLLERTDAPSIEPRVYDVDDAKLPAEESPALDTQTLKQWPMRGVVSALVKMVPLSVVFLTTPLIAVLNEERFEFGPFVIASVGALSLAALAVVGALGALGITKAVIVALATEYRFDDRRASETFDFLSSRETKFSADKITSMSVLRNPLDRLMGTMTVRLRSIGTLETIDFKYLRHDHEVLSALRRALGLETSQRDFSSSVALTPAFSVLEAIKAKAYLVWVVAPLWAITFGTTYILAGELGDGDELRAAALALAAVAAGSAVASIPYFLWRGVYHSRLQARLFDDHLEVSGGVFRRFCHLAAYRHIKTVRSERYPISTQGALALATGGGFAVGLGHLPDVVGVHDRIDERLSNFPPRASAPGAAPTTESNTTRRHLAAYAPHPPTELLRHLRLVVTLLSFPISGPYVFLLYRGAMYRIEASRIVAEIGLVYRKKTTVLFDRLDHLETSRNLANTIFSTSDVELYTVGSASCDLTLRSLHHADRALDHIRARMNDG